MRPTRFCFVLLLVSTVLNPACLAQVNLDEDVAFHGSYLYWDAEGKLNLVLRGRFFEPEKNSLARRLTRDRVIIPTLFGFIGKKPTDFDEASRGLMVERLSPFLFEGESGESLKMRVVGRGGAVTITLPETETGGHFAFRTATAGERPVTDLAANGKDLHVQVVVPDKDPRKIATRLPIPLRQPKLLVISDVDDTVRIAEVIDRRRMVERVFLHRYEAVPGISAIYNQLAERGAQFHFVSGSPWQIAPVIEEFLAKTKFPQATLHCRQLNWDFWNSDPLHTKEFKVATIEELLQQFSTGKVLMIGDDGEHDPEVYSEICKRHPDRIAGVWIRRVRETWDSSRLAGPMDLLGVDHCTAFQDASELKVALKKINLSR